MKCIRCGKDIKLKKSKSGRTIIYCIECIKDTGIVLVDNIKKSKNEVK